MAEQLFQREQKIDLSVDETFTFFADASNLERITPPELQFHILTPQPITIRKGTLIDYTLKLRGIPVTWRTEISLWNPPYSFVDRALKSPYKQWIHLHKFEQDGSGGCVMTDEVRYRLPFEPLGDVMNWYIRKELKYIFDYRRDAVEKLLYEVERRPVT